MSGIDVRAEVVAELLRPVHFAALERRRPGEGADLLGDAIVRALESHIVWEPIGKRRHFVRRVAARLRSAVLFSRLRRFYLEREALERLQDLAAFTDPDDDGGQS